jgi:hypothetical protein
MTGRLRNHLGMVFVESLTKQVMRVSRITVSLCSFRLHLHLKYVAVILARGKREWLCRVCEWRGQYSLYFVILCNYRPPTQWNVLCIELKENTEVPGSIPGHSLGLFWGSWVWNGVHSASWSDKLSSYLNKEVTVRFGKMKMQLWDSMCWPHVNPVPCGAVGKDCQRRLLSQPSFVRACSATDFIFIYGNDEDRESKGQYVTSRACTLLTGVY